MTTSSFDDRSARPTDRMLRTALGDVWQHWVRLRDALHADRGPLVEQWQWSAPAKGWSFRLKQPKRVLVYMLPTDRAFLASFSLGDQAWRAALELDLPAAMRAALEQAPKYAEGRGIRLPVRTKKDADAVLAILLLRSAA